MSVKEYLEEHAPILALIAAKLVNNPEWSLKLLEATARKLLLPMYRQQRDNSAELSQAIEAGQEVVRLCPWDVADLIALLHLLLQTERLEESLQLINLSITLKADRADYHRLRASVLERLDRIIEAEDAIERARMLLPDSTELQVDQQRIAVGVVEWLRLQRDNLSDLTKAIEAGQEVVRRCPDELHDIITLAHMLARAERLEEALHWIDQAIQFDADDADYLRLRASLLERLDRIVEAEDVIERAIALLPDSREMQEDQQRIAASVVTLHRQKRDTSTDLLQAIEAGQEVVRRCPDELHDIVTLAHMLVRAERLEEALYWIDQAIQFDADDADYLRLRASLLERLDRIVEAEDVIERAIALLPDSREMQEDQQRIAAGVVTLHRQERDTTTDLLQAIEAGQEVVRRCPDALHDIVALAHMLVRAERLEEALHWIDQVIQLKSGVAEYHRFRASLLERLGRFNVAYRNAKMALSLDPTSPVLGDDVSRLLKKLIVDHLGLSRFFRNSFVKVQL